MHEAKTYPLVKWLPGVILLGWACAVAGPSPIAESCVVVGFGQWLGSSPWGVPATLVPLRLSRARSVFPPDDPWYVIRSFRRQDQGWQEERYGNDILQFWTTRPPDSLYLWNVTGADPGMLVWGQWVGDTVRGRAHFEDDLRRDVLVEPRANAFIVRFDCTEAGAAAAFSAIEPLRAHEPPWLTISENERRLMRDRPVR